MNAYVKAVVAGLTALGGALLTALADGHVTATEWVVVGLAGLGGFTATWAAPKNAEPKP